MPISFDILGAPGGDNAALVRVASGKALHRLLCDCGDVGLDRLPTAEVHAVEQLLFSHLHMDHIGGFDAFFRRAYSRPGGPVLAWGPPRTMEILHHRFRGFLWNLHGDHPGAWLVHDIHPDRVVRARFEAREAFAVAHPVGELPHAGPIIAGPDYSVSALLLDHGTPSVGYLVREPPRRNVDLGRLAALGLAPGPWLRDLKYPAPTAPPTVEVGGIAFPRAQLAAALLDEQPGDSLAYLTDFRPDAAARAHLVAALAGCATLLCEAQYRADDLELARRNHHMTAAESAALARDAGVGRLVLFHLSDRYSPAEHAALLEEARAIFPNTSFPQTWSVDGRR